MIREELDAMTDEQLRIRAAELDGAKWYACKTIRVLEFGRPLGWHEASDDEMRLDLGEAWDSNIPDYLNDWGATGHLLEELVKMERYPELQNVGIRGHLWNIWLDPVPTTLDRDSDIVAQDENPKRAITKAFIIAMDNS